MRAQPPRPPRPDAPLGGAPGDPGDAGSLQGPDDGRGTSVELYTTDRCSFCRRAKGLLEAKGVAFREVYLPREDVESHVRLSRRTGMVTMPQVLVDGRLLGGWDELSRLEAAGLLDAVLGGPAPG